jgi:hypothetical protein
MLSKTLVAAFLVAGAIAVPTMAGTFRSLPWTKKVHNAHQHIVTKQILSRNANQMI